MDLLSKDKIETMLVISNSNDDLKKIVGFGYNYTNRNISVYDLQWYKLLNSSSSRRVS